MTRGLWHATIVSFCFIGIVLVSLNTSTAQVTELQHLAAAYFGADQGVFVQAEDGKILVAQQEARPVHPASVTKVATTLALLEHLGHEYRFETRFLAGGPVIDGSLGGDLIVRANGDPFFVFENAFLMLHKLHALGLHEVKGDIRVEGPLIFNWKTDPTGHRLKRALQGLDGGEAWAAIGEPSSRLNAVALRFVGRGSDDIIVGGPMKYVDGAIALPSGPGLGVKLDRDKLATYAEHYKLTGNYAYDRDPGRPGWYSVAPESRYANPADRSYRFKG